MEHRFKYWYKSHFDKIKAPPTTDVWANISAELNRRRRITFFKRSGAALLLLLFIGLGWMGLSYSSQQVPEESVLVSDLSTPPNSSEGSPTKQNDGEEEISLSAPVPALSSEKPITANSDVSDDGLKSSPPSGQSIVREKSENARWTNASPSLISSGLITTIPNTAMYGIVSENPVTERSENSVFRPTTNPATLYPIDPRPIYLHSFSDLALDIPEEANPNTMEDLLTSEEKPKEEAHQKIYYYTGYALGSSVLLNSKTSNGLSSKSLTSLKLSPKHNFDIGLMYRINKDYMLSYEMGKVTKSQKYLDYNDGAFSLYETKLNYLEFALALHHKSKRSLNVWGRKSSAYANAGIFVSRMYHSEFSADKLLVPSTFRYSSMDYGLQLGTSTMIPLSSRISVQPKVNVAIGLKNIFTGTGKIPANFNTTRTLNINSGINIVYSI